MVRFLCTFETWHEKGNGGEVYHCMPAPVEWQKPTRISLLALF